MKIKQSRGTALLLVRNAVDDTKVILLRDERVERGSGSRFLFGVSLTPHPTSRLATFARADKGKKNVLGFPTGFPTAIVT